MELSDLLETLKEEKKLIKKIKTEKKTIELEKAQGIMIEQDREENIDTLLEEFDWFYSKTLLRKDK